MKTLRNPAVTFPLSRHRRLAAAAVAAAAVFFALPTAHSTEPAGASVLVAAHDLPGNGRPLRPGDITTRTLPRDAVPAGTVRRAAGRVLAAPLRRGEAITDVRLRPGRLAQDPNSVVTPVRLADAEVAHMLRTGDQVDVLAARAEGPLPARTIVSAVRVAATPPAGRRGGARAPDWDGDSVGTDPGEGAVLLLETTREQAAALARAAIDSRLSVTIAGG